MARNAAGPEERAARDAEIVRLRRDHGTPVSELHEKFGLTEARIRQILAGARPAPARRRAARADAPAGSPAAARAAALSRWRGYILDIGRPGDPAATAASADSALKARAALRQIRRQAVIEMREAGWSDLDIGTLLGADADAVEAVVRGTDPD